MGPEAVFCCGAARAGVSPLSCARVLVSQGVKLRFDRNRTTRFAPNTVQTKVLRWNTDAVTLCFRFLNEQRGPSSAPLCAARTLK